MAARPTTVLLLSLLCAACAAQEPFPQPLTSEAVAADVRLVVGEPGLEDAKVSETRTMHDQRGARLTCGQVNYRDETGRRIRDAQFLVLSGARVWIDTREGASGDPVIAYELLTTTETCRRRGRTPA